jgi:hypothetical protein
MGARVVIRLNKYSMTVGSFEEFLKNCKENGLGPRGKIEYRVDPEGNVCLVAELPERAVESLTRSRTPKEPTKARKAVRGQLQARQEAVRSGRPVPGHVPAVVKGGKVLKTRKKKPA